MSDTRQSIPPRPPEKSNSSIIFIVGGLVVAVGVMAYLFTNDSSSVSGDAPAVNIENSTTSTAPAAEPAPAAPAAEPAPAAPAAESAPAADAAPAAEPAPEPAAPATQP